MSITTAIVNPELKKKTTKNLCAQNTHQKELERTTCITCFVLVEASPAAVFSCQSALATMKKINKYVFITSKKKSL
jgi:hypothetical protein